jgi:hypothetical protein
LGRTQRNQHATLELLHGFHPLVCFGFISPKQIQTLEKGANVLEEARETAAWVVVSLFEKAVIFSLPIEHFEFVLTVLFNPVRVFVHDLPPCEGHHAQATVIPP